MLRPSAKSKSGGQARPICLGSATTPIAKPAFEICGRPKMDKWQMYVETKNLFEAGENVSTALRDKVTPDQKRLLIEAVYDLQSGRYTIAYAANSQSEYHLYRSEERRVGKRCVIPCNSLW